jgi:acetoin utilization deacetylase AcuC-like enzyme
MRHSKIRTFYTERQINRDPLSYSRSPLKPKLLIEHFKQTGLIETLSINPIFKPFYPADFKIAHRAEYVNNFFAGKGNCSSSGVGWTKNHAMSVRYTNASLYNAIRTSVIKPSQVTFSATSGFHHARPDGGSGFCTFSGQVISAIKIYQEFGIRGCFIDLDGHFGNSIEDSRAFCKDLNEAVPMQFNINPTGGGEDYQKDLHRKLEVLETNLLSGYISYVVLCHGADSHIDDDLGSYCAQTTEMWLANAQTVYNMIKRVDNKLGKSVPLTLSLFGGYRSDHYDSVISLHTASIVECLNTLCGHNIEYTPNVVSKRKNIYANRSFANY